MERFNIFIRWLFSPSTFRGVIVGVTAIFGYVLPTELMAWVMGVGALVYSGWEMYMKQYDTKEQNAEVE